MTGLMLAVKLGGHDRNRIAKLLIKRGCDVHWRRPSDGVSAIFLASALFPNVGMIRVLASAGADVDSAMYDGTTAISYGEHSSSAPALESILDN